jgi:hypothetical protein
VRLLCVLSVVAVSILATAASPAGNSAVRIRRVSVTPDVPFDVATVRTTLANELVKVDGSRITSGRRADLTVSVGRKSRDQGEVEYTVSAVVLDARKGNVLGMLEGHAHSPRSPAIEKTTLEYAAHGALANVSAFLH